MSVAESALLMGFPERWILPSGSRVAQRAVGNALCIPTASAVVEAAMAEAAMAEAAAADTDKGPEEAPPLAPAAL